MNGAVVARQKCRYVSRRRPLAFPLSMPLVLRKVYILTKAQQKNSRTLVEVPGRDVSPARLHKTVLPMRTVARMFNATIGCLRYTDCLRYTSMPS